jgi:hypothetical protein
MSLTFDKWQKDRAKKLTPCSASKGQYCIPSQTDKACLICFSQAAQDAVTDTFLKGDLQ